jgi:DNA polymerase III delta prime subunit
MTPNSSIIGNNADFADFGIEGNEEKPFPVHCLPLHAWSYLQDICKVDSVVPALPGACMLATLSMALGSGAELHTGKHRVRGNLFVLGSAPSGTGKSVVFNRVVQPLLEHERLIVKNWEEKDLPAAKAMIKLLKQKQDILHKQSSKQSQSSDLILPELVDIERQLAAQERSLEKPSLIFGEATREKIVEMLSRSPRETLASASAEARGCVNSLLGRYNAKTDEDVLVAAWTGDYYKLSRINRPETVLQNPCLSLLWLVQPDLMDQLLSVNSMSESGLLARTLLFEVSSMSQEKSAEPPLNSLPNGEAWGQLAHWLAKTAYGQSHPMAMQCVPEVVQLMTAMDSGLQERRRPGGDLADVSIFAARWVEQTWRIMLVLHAAKQWHMAPHHVSIDTAREAIQLMDWFATQQLLLLTARRERRHDERFDKLVEILQRKPGHCYSLRDMRRRHGFHEDETRRIVENHPGILEIKNLNSQGPGRPSPSVFLLP